MGDGAKRLSEIVEAFVSPRGRRAPLPLMDAEAAFDSREGGPRSLNAAFMLALAEGHPRAREAADRLERAAADGDPVAAFYVRGLDLVGDEVDTVAAGDPELAGRLEGLAEHLADGADETLEGLAERTWSVFFPEGVGIRGHEEERIEELRRRRMIEITAPGPAPIADPAAQVLFTANALITGPGAGRDIEDLDVADEVKEGLRAAAGEPQRFWYDHPVQIGVESSGSELRYGLAAVDRGLAFEKERGTMAPVRRLRFVLSVSTTHIGLESVASRYIEDEVRGMGGLDHIELYAFTEAHTDRLIDEVLAPAAERWLDRPDARDALAAFGVRGPYGRHHSFGKAIAPLWHVLVDPEVVATFKTDLDHSWPQEELVAETGASLLEHFRFPLWGGTGQDREGRALDLGGMAGSLVNEADIHRGLFTPDVPFPEGPLDPDHLVFFSALTQGLSTLGEASTRYGPEGPDGETTALERVHVHGGTVGLLVRALRRHRPFTPSFIARAEDQAYVLSLVGEPEPRLAYVHNRRLIQRHDKKGFAGEAIEASKIPTMVGDYERILLFSELGDALTKDRAGLKAVADPFTGAFISRLPITVTFLRFALKAEAMAAAGAEEDAREFVTGGAARLPATLDFVAGDPSELEARVRAEREGWDLFYEVLDAIERSAQAGQPFAEELVDRARAIVADAAIF